MAVHEVSGVEYATTIFWRQFGHTTPRRPYAKIPQCTYRALALGLAAALHLAAQGLVSVASVVVTHAVFFGEDRYHMVLTPALAILAACALRKPVSDDAAAEPAVP